MSFTEAENAALGALAEGFPVPEVNVMDVEASHSKHYLKQVRNLAVNVIYYAKMYDMSVDPGLAADKEVILAERRKTEDAKLAARIVETREAMVSGWLAGLIPKANKAGGDVSFEIDDSYFSLTVYGETGRDVVMEYDRESRTVATKVGGEWLAEEDWTMVSGNKRPSEQSSAYEAVQAFLERQAAPVEG